MKSIRTKLFFITITAVFGGIILTGAVFTILFNRLYLSTLKENLFEQSLTVGEIMKSTPEAEIPSEVESLTKQLGGKIRITVIRHDGSVIADSEYPGGKMENHLERPEIIAAEKNGAGFDRRISATLGREYFYAARKATQDSGAVIFTRVAAPVENANSTLWHIGYMALIAAASTLLLAAVMMRFITRRFAAPIDRLTETSERIAGGEFDARSGLGGADEFGRLGAAIDRMAGVIQKDMLDLKQKNDETERTLASLRDGLVVLSSESKILLINDAALRIFGIETRDYSGTPFINVIHHMRINEMVLKTLGDGTYCEAEIELKPIAKTFVDVRVFPYRDRAREADGVVIVVRDISKLKQLEIVRTEFVENASHEMRTPVAMIRGFVETLLGGAMNDETDRTRFLILLDKESLRLSNLMVDILALASAERSDDIQVSQEIDVVEKARDCVSEYQTIAADRDLALETDFIIESAAVSIPAQDFRSILSNLIDNAIKFTEKGKIVVSVRRTEQHVLITVSDTGIGIRSEDQKRIFERFYRADKSRSRAMGGTGLGLSIVRHLTGKWGGSVSVRSKPGEGSSFTVDLPI